MADPDNNQSVFWEAMKEKYERRNESLRQQEICLRKRLEQLKEIMDKQKAGDDCDCVPEKLEKPGLVQCLVEKGKNLILGSCKCGDPKLGEDLLCACHIQDPKAPINVDPNLCPNRESPPPEGCLNTTCDFYDPTLANLAENPSTFSLKTTDIYYMDKLADLVKAEKNMQLKIEDLEKREHSYLTAIHDLQEAMKKKPRTDPMSKEFKKLTEGLEEENKKLRNEIQDLRLELKHCFERVEGPLRRSLEEQRDKCFKLENQLKDLQVRTRMKEDSYMKEINEVKAKLCQACCTMVDLNNVNSKLKNDLDLLQNKCANLEDELLKQQLKEAENILKFKNALSRRSPRGKIQAKGDESEQDLGHIARKLGDTLREVCPCVSDVPSGLAEAAEDIRQLTELVGEKGAQQRRKRKGKIPQVSTSSCACGSGPSILETQPKPHLADKDMIADSCACSNSSLRMKPKIGKNDFTEDFFGRSSATLASIPKMNIGAPKFASTPKSSVAPVKKTASKGCTCCPNTAECEQVERVSIETLCSCTDVDKKIGPSEEVIAVKNLGAFSMPPENVICQPFDASILNQTKSRREKLAVDTTCDVLDTPPKDIHIVTTIAKTGSLEITTEGPPGIIETKVNYLKDGKIEIVTKLIDRNHMDHFLDGTLLHAPEGPPDCDESNTCGGQCEEVLPFGCPEVDCNKSQTCGGICEGGNSAPKEENLAIVEHDLTSEEVEKEASPYGQVVVNNNFVLCNLEPKVNLLATKEWKNDNFQEDPKEETLLGEMVIVAKPKRKRQDQNEVHEDVTSGEEVLRLSSRQSLTDVEKCTKDEKTMESSGSLASHDVLDTISEENEEQADSSKTESENEENSLTTSSESEPSEASDKSGDLVDIPKSTHNEEVTQMEEKAKGDEDLESPQIENPLSVTLLPHELNDEQSSHRSLKICRSSTVLEEISSDSQITESFYRLSENVNVFNGRITLKQSKSMYEKRGSRSEYLRICKSATLSLGSLKIDMERLRLSTIGPNVGDFGQSRSEERNRMIIENVQQASKLEDKNKDADEKISAMLKEGCNFLETCQPVLEQTYQCYVCSCSKQKDKDDKQKRNPQNTRNSQDLEERIDRLLEIDPLAATHGIDCQCVDCLVQNAQRSNAREDCRCSRKKQDNKPDPTTKRCKCGSKKEAPTTPKLEAPKHQGDNFEHGENCTCVDCICNPCNFKKEAAASCDCRKCECDACCDKDKNLTRLMTFELPKPQEVTVMNVSMPCDCGGKCPCSPCMDASKKPPPKARPQPPAKPQGKPQEAACKRCAGKAPGAEGAKRSDVSVASSKVKAETKAGSPVATLPDTWKNVVGCPCAPPVPDKKAVCDCKTCECKPCGYPEKARAPCDCKPPKKEPKGPQGNCDCKMCRCESHALSPIGDTLNTSINCDCKLCECLFCSDSKARKQSKNAEKEEQGICECKPKCLCDSCPLRADNKTEAKEETIVPIKVPTGSQKICGCKPKCLCESCSVYAENVGDAGRGTGCDCAKCECNPCFDPRSPALQNFLRELDTKEEIKPKFDVKVTCDCGTCGCDECGGKIQEQNRGDNTSQNVTACVCDTCDCSNCPKKPRDVEVEKKNKGDVSDEKTVSAVKDQEKRRGKICPCMKKADTNAPTEECHDCGICSMVSDISTDQEEKEITPGKTPCDCSKPCSCSPCPDPHILGDQKIGDADRAKEEIQNVLNKIGCTCDQAEVNLKPLVKQASNFETTISRMKMKLNNLQQKCKDKDQIIESMTKDLRMRSESGVFADLLHDLAHPRQRYIPDFDRTYVCDFLPKPNRQKGAKLQAKRSSLCRFDNRLEPILELDRYLPGTKEEVSSCPKGVDVSGMEIIDIRRVTIDSILIKWRGPPCVNGLTGYQIFVNEELRYRVLSPNRTNAVIDSLDLSSSIEVMLFAITTCGRCEPPALATYKI